MFNVKYILSKKLNFKSIGLFRFLIIILFRKILVKNRSNSYIYSPGVWIEKNGICEKNG